MSQEPREVYARLKEQYQSEYEHMSRRHRSLGLLRLLDALLVLWCFYTYFTRDQVLWLVPGLLALGLFVYLVKRHRTMGQQKIRLATLLQINKEELAYLAEGAMPFANGQAYRDETHAYSADLDLFGPRSLYQHLNRTATQMGQDRLASGLNEMLPEAAIREKQQAVVELGLSLNWRQESYASGRMAQDSRERYDNLLRWSEKPEPAVGRLMLALAYIFPAALIGILLLYALFRTPLYWDIALRLFPVNLLLFALSFKRIKQAIAGTEQVNETLSAYAAIFEQIETANWQSPYLKSLQQGLQGQGIKASTQLQQLARIYKGMEAVLNPFSAVITNGLYLYHVHLLQRLSRWKGRHEALIPQWLQVIGEVELLNSLANLHYNNPSFCFPALNQEQRIVFRDLGHPLIGAERRIYNDIAFDQHRFVILTGSNMSGKSTFLRTLGVNMVLAGMGGPVCARVADIQPLPVLVSMRQSDSLADSESYFFAEVKRLKAIMDRLEQGVCFVLLDEILRGTNSDDKRSGTIGVIRKMISKKAIGAIATHDLEVCLTTAEYPGVLCNKCFEVEIINDELVFDYKLREGICKNKSATFLMHKMDIIA
ncbi:MutS-related protein [Taibaiella koreensis]|uniref:MutS-related protein n=1 Tax=Taibaiella koreensis TaxID=1268548 RepID=UPI000E59DB19|nr:DNA mismatch repair protein [Taibaiella koreensis]